MSARGNSFVGDARVYVASLFIACSVLLLSGGGICAQSVGTRDSSAFERADTSSRPSLSTVLVASLPPGIMLGAAIYQNWDTYWKHDGRVPFHVVSEPAYALQNDKLGHAFYTSLTADVIRTSYSTAGVDARTAVWLGSSLALLAELLVEVEDGMHPSAGTGGAEYYGFSPGDATADIIGAALPLVRHYYSPFRNVDFKISMWPSEALERHVFQSIVDDDESHYYWLSLNVHDAVGLSYWPSWLNLCAGYSVEQLEVAHYAFSDVKNYLPAGALYIGLDLNLRGLPIEGKAWTVIADVLSHFKIPLPALQLTPRVRLWGFR